MNTNRKPSVIHGIPLKRKPSRHRLSGRQYLPSLKIMLGPLYDTADQTGFISSSSPRIAYAITSNHHRWQVDTVEWVSGDTYKRDTVTGDDETITAEQFIQSLKS